MNVGSERQVVHPRAMAASLPAAFFPAAEHVSFSGSPRPVPALERLSWPVAMAEEIAAVLDRYGKALEPE